MATVSNLARPQAAPRRQSRILVLLPAYNEEENIGPPADDGSQDRNLEILNEYAQLIPGHRGTSPR